MTTAFGVRFEDHTPDSQIAAWISAQLLEAGRFELGYCVARIAAQAGRVERDSAVLPAVAVGEAAVPPPMPIFAQVQPGDGPRGDGDADIASAAAQPDPPPTDRCAATSMAGGVPVECRHVIYLADGPREVGEVRGHTGPRWLAYPRPRWLHLDPTLDDDHPAVGPGGIAPFPEVVQ